MPNGKAVPCKFPGFQSVTVIDSATYDAQFADNCWVDPAKKDFILPNCSRPVRKRSLVPSLFPKTIILPRQTRDKRRKKYSKKATFFLR